MDCVRSIKFIIPGIGGTPDVEVLAVEKDGTIEFTVSVLEAGDGVVGEIRGLFFNVNDDSKLDGLLATGDDVTDQDTGEVIDLGQGANMHGAADPFDAGIEFGRQGIGKDDTRQTTFTLTNANGDLTLDDIAQVEFGARVNSIGVPGSRFDSAKLTTIAPAAPDAMDDVYDIFEDGASGLDDPRDSASGVLFEVLENDTDADGDTLTITHVYGAVHGTVEIVDGDDADLLPGDAILYTPYTDYSGSDEFTYCITDNNGGTDYATVSVQVAAVADIPDVSIEAFATNNINEVLLTVTATQTDDDFSEFIDLISTSDLPAGVMITPMGTVNPIGQPTQIVQQYLLTLPLDQDTDFDLTFTATSKEISNGDTETGSASIEIASAFGSLSDQLLFDATDQSIWNSGEAFVFAPNIPFLGFDEADSGNWGGDVLGGSWSYDVRVGLEQELLFEGGSVDIEVPYDITVEAFYNITTDVLQLDPLVNLAAGAGFLTDGPAFSYMLDLIFELAIGTNLTVAGFDFPINFPSVDETVPLINYDSETSPPFQLGDDDDALSATLAWPNIDVAGTHTGGSTFEGQGESNDVLELNLDVDQTIADLFFGGVNPFDFGIDFFSDFWETGAEAGIELLDFDLNAGLNFFQDFVLDTGTLVADIVFESGDTFLFDFTTPTQYANASQYDLNGDGTIEFDLVFDAVGETFSNDTDLNLNVGYSLSLLEGYYQAGVLGAVASGSIGPAYSISDETDVAQFDIFSTEFAIDLGGDNFAMSIG